MSFKSKVLYLLSYPINLLHNKISRNQFLIVSGVLVGLIAGFAAIILKTLVHYIHLLLSNKQIASYDHLVLLFSPLLGILLTIIVVKIFFNGRLGKGVANILYEIAQKSSFVYKDKMYSHILTSSLTVGFGGSVGLESPIVVTGSAIGSNYARLFHLNYKERTVLLAAGAAAGIGAVFNAPIAGVMFAIEIILADIVITELIAIITAAVSGALLSKIILQEDMLFFFNLTEKFDYHNVPFYIALGILSGFISLYYIKITHLVEGIFEKYKIQVFKKAIIGGIILGILCLFFPPLFGEGYESIKSLASNSANKLLENSLFQFEIDNEYFIVFFVGIIMLIKVLATSITLSSGGNGGNFAPSLFVGAFSGYFFAKSINLADISHLPESNFTLVGMSGILSGVMHAPLTAIFLIAEVTGGYELIIPLMIVSSTSYLISKHFEPYSMDTKKLASKNLIFTANKDKNILSQLKTQEIIETDIKTIDYEGNLGDLVEVIKTSKRNIFAVITKEHEFKGIINLDDVRAIMFRQEMYLEIKVKQVMKRPHRVIQYNDSVETILKKFDETNEWNLPVVKNKKYRGFISKSKLHIKYRSQLIEQTGCQSVKE